jgi:dihydrodipicolinate synthase/N-acetylneuraminate lyase
MMMDQATMLRRYDFPAAMVLPQREIATPSGVAGGVRRFAEALGKPVVLYLKHDGYLAVDAARRLMDDGLVAWIKYAVVREDAAQDDLLRQLVEAVDPRRIVSGMGEQPALVHMRDFRLVSFTSGCVCVAPGLSTKMLRAIQTQDYALAARILERFRPLEELRNRIHPIRVLHRAVSLAGIADTGPILPLLNDIDGEDLPRIRQAAVQLLEENGGVTA